MGSSVTEVRHQIFLTYCHEIVGLAMKWLVQQHFPLSTISEAQNFQKTRIDLPKKQYDLVVLDAEMGDSAQMLGTLKHIKNVSPNTRILVFSEQDERIYGPTYLAFGINGYLTKKAGVNSIVFAIKTVLSGGLLYGIPDPSNNFGKLSIREKQIFDLLIQGISLTEIAKYLNLKETTISTFKKRIFHKMGASTLSDLIAIGKVYK